MSTISLSSIMLTVVLTGVFVGVAADNFLLGLSASGALGAICLSVVSGVEEIIGKLEELKKSKE